MSRIDLNLHRALEAEGYLSIQTHPTAPLLIHNYTAKAQYERHWNEATLMSRGLITDLDGLIVARPFGKFFNLSEYTEHVGALPQEAFRVYEKLDGSMGVLYFLDGQPYLATRGSFTSEQALKGTQILRARYGHLEFDPELTYVFEIIYPENRIVVDYGQQEDLVLLGRIVTRTGEELPLEGLQMPKAKVYTDLDSLEKLTQVQEDNAEGFVVRFEGGLRVKVKFDEYVRLHKILTNFSSRHVWEALKEGGGLDAYLEDVPDEFYGWVRGLAAELHAAYKAIEQEALAEFRYFEDRREAAAYYLAECRYPGICFRLLDERPYDEIIWKMVRPAYSTAFSDAGEGAEPAE